MNELNMTAGQTTGNVTCVECNPHKKDQVVNHWGFMKRLLLHKQKNGMEQIRLICYGELSNMLYNTFPMHQMQWWLGRGSRCIEALMPKEEVVAARHWAHELQRQLQGKFRAFAPRDLEKTDCSLGFEASPAHVP